MLNIPVHEKGRPKAPFEMMNRICGKFVRSD
jgi:hypothetical protein